MKWREKNIRSTGKCVKSISIHYFKKGAKEGDMNMKTHHFAKQTLLNGEWVDSFRTMADLNSRHSLLYRLDQPYSTCNLYGSVPKKSRGHRKKIMNKRGKYQHHAQSPQVIQINRSFSDPVFHAGNIQRATSADSGYSGVPLGSPFRTITDMFDIASIERHRNYYFKSS